MGSKNQLQHQSTYLALILLVGASLVCEATSRTSTLEDASTYERHRQWMSKFGRVYSDNNERHKRFNIFRQNVALIDSFNNANDKPYNLAVNQFADLTNEEFTASRNGFKGHMCSNKATSFIYENITALPSTVDSRKKGAVTPIKDQGQCGCCWAFSAVAAMEGVTKLTTEEQRPNTESNYPYKGVDGTCNSNEEANHAATINGFQDVPANSEDELQKAVANQPVSVAIDASGFEFQFYSSGVFTGSCGTQLDHGVTAIGYGEDDDGTKYWLVKNSWGSSWGEEGYIRMQRDVDAKEGLCGIAMQASYPTA
ncbi:hypothetical protein V6N11_040137 [Hibiscus sabdariffa]|uniref:Uncharacterized protein n=1 Tax=Hibiscus sabdariffa TaxID=183260 RepID=A0ABR2RH72_9ROSI